MNADLDLEALVKTCQAHFPQHHYEWLGRVYAHCAICRSDYSIREIEGVTLNDQPLYTASVKRAPGAA